MAAHDSICSDKSVARPRLSFYLMASQQVRVSLHTASMYICSHPQGPNYISVIAFCNYLPSCPWQLIRAACYEAARAGGHPSAPPGPATAPQETLAPARVETAVRVQAMPRHRHMASRHDALRYGLHALRNSLVRLERHAVALLRVYDVMKYHRSLATAYSCVKSAVDAEDGKAVLYRTAQCGNTLS